MAVFTLVAELLCLLGILVCTIMILVKMLKLKKKYFTSGWNVVDLIQLCLAHVAVAIYITRNVLTVQTVERVFNNQGLY